ncbi:hypothetical protein SHPE106448_08825 [Shewanella pealeana]
MNHVIATLGHNVCAFSASDGIEITQELQM